MFCRLGRVAGAAAGAALLVLSAFTASKVSAAVVMSPNLLINPGAEFGDPSLSAYSSVSIPGWSVTGTPTVIKYGTLRRLPWPLGSPGPTLPAALGFPQRAERTARRCRTILRRWKCGHIHAHPIRRSVRCGAADRHRHRAIQAERMARRLPGRPVRSVGHCHFHCRQPPARWAPARSGRSPCWIAA